MDKFLRKVGPLTVGMIWISQKLSNQQSEHFKSLDYLLNGLLSQTLGSQTNENCHVLVSNNFHSNFMTFIFEEFDHEKYLSFLNLIKNELKPERSIIVVDEQKFFTTLLEKTPKELRSFLHLYQ
jgi:hypothetical protein